MRDLRVLLREIERLTEAGEPYVIATVVRIDGSAYRGVGTRMLIKRDGSRVGTISGGCLERDVVENAEEVFASGERKILTYDATSEEDLLWGTGLGCSGVIQVMLERLPEEGAVDYPRILMDCVFDRRPAVMATLFDANGAARYGQRLILDRVGSVTSDIVDERFRQLVLRDTREEMAAVEKANPSVGQGRTRMYDLDRTRAGILLEPLIPPSPSSYSAPATTPSPSSRWPPALAGKSLWSTTVRPLPWPSVYPKPSRSSSDVPRSSSTT